VKRIVLKSEISIGSYLKCLDDIFVLSEVKNSSYICLVNVHMLIEAYDDDDFAGVVNSADMALPDGSPVAKSIKYLHCIDQDRVAGMDIMSDLMNKAEQREKSIFLYGSTENVLSKIVKKSGVVYPNLEIHSYSPPFRQLSDDEKLADIEMINKVNPDFVFVALGCPKQERWMYDNKGQIKSCMIGLGGVFPVFAGEVGRSPLWMQRNSLEWLYRLIKEPRRLWKRYLYTNSKFLFFIMFQYIRVKLLRKLR